MSDPIGWPSDCVGAGRSDDAAEYRGLVCQRLSSHWPRWLLISFGPPHFRHAGGPGRPHAGGSLRDVQLLAGHRSIQTTQRYIDGEHDAQRKLVVMI